MGYQVPIYIQNLSLHKIDYENINQMCGKAEALQGNPCGVSSDLNVPLVCWTFSVDCRVKLLLHVIEIIKDTFI